MDRVFVKRIGQWTGFALLSIVFLASLIGCSSSDGPSLKLYGALHSTANSGTSLLYEINMTDGTGTLIGDTGYALSGMAYDDTSGKLYGTTTNNDSNFPNGIVEINMNTGAATAIGTGAGMYVNCPAFDSDGNMFAWTEDSDDPVTVNLETGVATVIGESGFSSYQQGMAFDGNDVLYFVNGDGELFTINTSTGAGTSLGTFTDLPAYMAHHGSLHPETGEYWGLDNTNNTTSTRNMLILDLDTIALSTETTPNTISTIDDLHMITFVYK